MTPSQPSQQSYLARLGFLFPDNTGSIDPDQAGSKTESGARPRRGLPSRLHRLTSSHLKVLSALGLAGVIFATWMVMQARSLPLDDPVEVPTLVEPTPSPTPVQIWLVHVTGAVAEPGVVSLPQGARVIDAIEAAGGLTEDADPAELNLAAVLIDGCQIVIGTSAQPRGEVRHGVEGLASSDQAGQATAAGKVDLNQATQAQLETLPGVGPVTAQAILEWRDHNGKFETPAQLQEVDGIGAKTFARVEPYVSV